MGAVVLFRSPPDFVLRLKRAEPEVTSRASAIGARAKMACTNKRKPKKKRKRRDKKIGGAPFFLSLSLSLFLLSLALSVSHRVPFRLFFLFISSSGGGGSRERGGEGEKRRAVRPPLPRRYLVLPSFFFVSRLFPVCLYWAGAFVSSPAFNWFPFFLIAEVFLDEGGRFLRFISTNTYAIHK